MVQWIRKLTTKSDDQNSISRTKVVGRENIFTSCPTYTHTSTHTHMSTHTRNKKNTYFHLIKEIGAISKIIKIIVVALFCLTELKVKVLYLKITHFTYRTSKN